MKYQLARAVAAVAALTGVALAAPTAEYEAFSVVEKRALLQGFDISNYQGDDFPFASAKSAGAKFGILKATEGETAESTYSSQHAGIIKQGLVRGAYHYAVPSQSSGASQADFFVAHGGNWVDNGKTLPGAVDLEDGTQVGSSYCYGLTEAGMVAWIRAFGSAYKSKTKRYPMIYTSHDWWQTCTGGSTAFHDYPLWVVAESSTVGTLPGKWPHYTIWQYGTWDYNSDGDRFNGDAASLTSFAHNS